MVIMSKYYASIIVIRSEDKKMGDYEIMAHREEFTKRFDYDKIENLVKKTIEYSYEVQRALFACTKGLKEINHMELVREIYKIRLMQEHYNGDLCLWQI